MAFIVNVEHVNTSWDTKDVHKDKIYAMIKISK